MGVGLVGWVAPGTRGMAHGMGGVPLPEGPLCIGRCALLQERHTTNQLANTGPPLQVCISAMPAAGTSTQTHAAGSHRHSA